VGDTRRRSLQEQSTFFVNMKGNMQRKTASISKIRKLLCIIMYYQGVRSSWKMEVGTSRILYEILKSYCSGKADSKLQADIGFLCDSKDVKLSVI